MVTHEEVVESTQLHVAGFLYTSDGHPRDRTVCKILGRGNPETELGFEPCFEVIFSDGYETEVLAHQLTPWFHV